MTKKPHEVLATRPEAVVLSYERYLKLAGGRQSVAELLARQVAKLGAGLDPDEALQLADDELHAARRERHASGE